MTKRILVMGLPGSGKTTLSQELVRKLMLTNTVSWFNADTVREKYNDWDFSPEGRIRQSVRMKEMADNANTDFVICDFVAALPEMRKKFDADITIWLDTITSGRFEDTNKAFQPPSKFNYRITSWEKDTADKIISDIIFRPGDSNIRSITKAASWRALGTLDTFILSWFITGEVKLAAAIGGTEIFTKMFLYWLHERAWNKIHWGKNIK